MNRSRNRLSLVLVTMLVAAGCGDGGNTPDDQAGADGKSPLAPYLGDSFRMSGGGGGGGMTVRVGGGGGTEPTEEDLAKMRKVEDAIATCMRQEGFQYVPKPPEADAKGKFDDAFNLPPDKFAEQYGYGITTIDWGDPMEDNPDDPNTAIRNALSAQAKKAYDKALNGAAGNGERVIAEKPSSGASPKPMDMGCRGKAMTEVFGERKGGADLRKFDSLFKDLEALQKRIGSDPRVTEAAKAWSDCMADGGKTGLSKPEDAPEKVHEQLAELTGDESLAPPGEAKKMPEPSLENVDPAELAKLRTSEIELAKLDQSCRKTGYEDAYKQVQFELEEQFVEANKAQLEQFKESTSNAREGK